MTQIYFPFDFSRLHALPPSLARHRVRRESKIKSIKNALHPHSMSEGRRATVYSPGFRFGELLEQSSSCQSGKECALVVPPSFVGAATRQPLREKRLTHLPALPLCPFTGATGEFYSRSPERFLLAARGLFSWSPAYGLRSNRPLSVCPDTLHLACVRTAELRYLLHTRQGVTITRPIFACTIFDCRDCGQIKTPFIL